MITEKLQVLTPTKEDYIKVVQCMLDNENVWVGKDKDILEDFWNNYKENTIIFLNYWGENEITYGYKLEDDHTTYTTKEFLDKYNKKDYKLDNKTMNIKKIVKTLTLSKEDKLLREYGLQNDCGDFTEEAKEIVINKLVEDNKAYLVEIATQVKEEDKK